MVELCEAGEAGLAEQRQMNRESERAEAGIGADIARRFLAPDVLLARRQGQYEAAAALDVGGLAGEAARHLAHEFLARREEAEIRAAEFERIAERLTFGRNDIG